MTNEQRSAAVEGLELTARGAAALPFAAKLMASKDRDLREAGAGVLAGLRDSADADEIVQYAMDALASEQDRLVIDTLIGVLGKLRTRQAVPLLKRYIVDEQEDGDTRWEAAVSLGRIVGKRFDSKGANAVERALEWLRENPVKDR